VRRRKRRRGKGDRDGRAINVISVFNGGAIYEELGAGTDEEWEALSGVRGIGMSHMVIA
jgi:hypothetical protein